MASRYWVGGSATWDSTAGTKWATTSGGTGGAAIPTSADDVYLDASSGSVTVTLSGFSVCNNFTCTGFTGTLSHPAAVNLQVYGSLLLVSGMGYSYASSTTSIITLCAVGTGKNVSTGGKTLGTLVFNGIGGGWTFQANATIDYITLMAGAVATNRKSITTYNFLSTGSSVQSLTLSDSLIIIDGGINDGWKIFGSDLTLDAGTSSIVVTATAKYFYGGGKTYYHVEIETTSGALTLTGQNTFSTLIVTNGLDLLVGDNQTVGNFGLSTPSAQQRINVLSKKYDVVITITAAVTSLEYASFYNITGAGAAAWTGTSLGDIGGNSGITFTAPVTRYWRGFASSDWSNPNSWSATDGGMWGVSAPLPQDTAIFKTITLGYTDVKLDWAFLCKITATEASRAITFNRLGVTGYYVCGDLTLSSNVTINTGYSWTALNSLNINQASASISTDMRIACRSDETVTLTSDFSMTATSYGLYVYNGTLNANNYDVTVPKFAALGSASSLSMGSGTWTLTHTGNVWDTSSYSIGTQNVGTSTVVVNNTTATAKTLKTGSWTFYNLTITGDNIAWDGSATINALALNNAGCTNGFKMGTGTKTISSFSTNGSAGSPSLLRSTTTDTARTISMASGTVVEEYMDIRDSTATGGATWYAGGTSINSGNNTGWIFGSAISPTTLASTTAFGTLTTKQTVTMVGLASTLAIGSMSVLGAGQITSTGIVPTLSFGTLVITVGTGFTATGFTNTNLFGYFAAFPKVGSATSFTPTARPKTNYSGGNKHGTDYVKAAKNKTSYSHDR